MISIDNCCKWRKLLKQSLGDDVEVKLDLFAVKRVSTALSKKHSHFYQALQDFRLVFRIAGDNGLQRKKATPPSEILLKNINTFVSKWSNISGSNGNNSIITLAVLKEISNLKVHITKGCLSNIPAHFGTSKNENMHKLLNSRFSGNHLGVELAVALLAVFFHNWNQRNGKHCISNISQYLLSQIGQQIDEKTSSTLPKFGIGVSSQRSYLFDNVKTSAKNKAGAWDVLQRVGKQAMSPNSESLSEDMVYSVLHDAFSLLNSEEVLNSMSDVHAHVTRILPSGIGNAVMHSQNHGLPADSVPADSVSRLNNVLQSFAMQKHEVPMNGDCLFSSIILYLNKTFQINSESNLIDHLNSIGITPQSCDVLLIRNLMVDEWIFNKEEYQSFFDDEMQFENEAQHYRASGIYTTQLGDAMLLGLCNVLHLQIIVFTSIPSWPYVTVNPRCTQASEQPLCLAFLHEGSGHYCLATKQNEEPDCSRLADIDCIKTRATGDVKSCRCGRGRNFHDVDRINCCSNKFYSSRCPCLINDLLCTISCKCINCGNSSDANQRSESSSAITKENRRKRARHIEQDFIRKEGWKFMKKENEQTISGLWSEQEHYVFLATVLLFRRNGKDLSTKDMLDFYNLVREVSEKDRINVILSPKTQTQISAKLKQLQKEEDTQRVCGLINYLPQ